MNTENVEVSVSLPHHLWEKLHWFAQAEQAQETSLLIRALEQFLQYEAEKSLKNKQLQRECAELTTLIFDDVGTEDEWLIVQNEALRQFEKQLS